MVVYFGHSTDWYRPANLISLNALIANGNVDTVDDDAVAATGAVTVTLVISLFRCTRMDECFYYIANFIYHTDYF